MQMQLSIQQIRTVQESLVDVWQAHVEDWSEKAEGATVHVPAPPPAQPLQQPAERRVHVTRPISDGGLFCCKWSKRTQYVKHLRLKISKKPRASASLPPERWLSQPVKRKIWARSGVLAAAAYGRRKLATPTSYVSPHCFFAILLIAVMAYVTMAETTSGMIVFND